MNRMFKLAIITMIGCSVLLAQSCKARDCKGRKKTAKTAMGGWL